MFYLRVDTLKPTGFHNIVTSMNEIMMGKTYFKLENEMGTFNRLKTKVHILFVLLVIDSQWSLHIHNNGSLQSPGVTNLGFQKS